MQRTQLNECKVFALKTINMARKKNTKLWEWQKNAQKGGVCTRCGQHYDCLTVDHIIPKGILEVISEDAVYEDEENFELSCFACNRFKGMRIDLSNPKTKPLMLKYSKGLPDIKF